MKISELSHNSVEDAYNTAKFRLGSAELEKKYPNLSKFAGQFDDSNAKQDKVRLATQSFKSMAKDKLSGKDLKKAQSWAREIADKEIGKSAFHGHRTSKVPAGKKSYVTPDYHNYKETKGIEKKYGSPELLKDKDLINYMGHQDKISDRSIPSSKYLKSIQHSTAYQDTDAYRKSRRERIAADREKEKNANNLNFLSVVNKLRPTHEAKEYNNQQGVSMSATATIMRLLERLDQLNEISGGLIDHAFHKALSKQGDIYDGNPEAVAKNKKLTHPIPGADDENDQIDYAKERFPLLMKHLVKRPYSQKNYDKDVEKAEKTYQKDDARTDSDGNTAYDRKIKALKQRLDTEGTMTQKDLLVNKVRDAIKGRGEQANTIRGIAMTHAADDFDSSPFLYHRKKAKAAIAAKDAERDAKYTDSNYKSNPEVRQAVGLDKPKDKHSIAITKEITGGTERTPQRQYVDREKAKAAARIEDNAKSQIERAKDRDPLYRKKIRDANAERLKKEKEREDKIDALATLAASGNQKVSDTDIYDLDDVDERIHETRRKTVADQRSQMRGMVNAIGRGEADDSFPREIGNRAHRLFDRSKSYDADSKLRKAAWDSDSLITVIAKGKAKTAAKRAAQGEDVSEEADNPQSTTNTHHSFTGGNAVQGGLNNQPSYKMTNPEPQQDNDQQSNTDNSTAPTASTPKRPGEIYSAMRNQPRPSMAQQTQNTINAIKSR